MQKKVFAIDLDGTLTEHRTWITDENLAMLDMLRERGIRPVIVGAGQVRRINTQMKKYPIEIIGNYGLQYAVYRDEIGDIEYIRDTMLSCDKDSVLERIHMIREQYGYTAYEGESAEFHPSGCVTFALLGTRAGIPEKLLFDPDSSKRRAMLEGVSRMFPEYGVFIGGLTSLDMVPRPYNKYYALELFMKEMGYTHDDLLYFGDDYESGGNDEPVLLSDIDFIKVDKPSSLPILVEKYLESEK